MNQTYIIAEAGVNHNGSVETAKQLVNIAAEAGADAVKFQTFRAHSLVTLDAPKAAYQREDSSESQYEMLKKLELNEEAHTILLKHCRQKNIQFLSTPFDLESVDLLTRLGVSQIKISSADITNAPLLLKCAKTNKPIILSTGMSLLADIETALGVLAFGYLNPSMLPSLQNFRTTYVSEKGQNLLKEKVALLHCVSAYPSAVSDANLKTMDTLRMTFGLQVGFSDHSLGICLPIAAVARGATLIEKHFTLDKTLPGPDHRSSLEPLELKEMVRSIRQVEQAFGSTLKIPTPAELKNAPFSRKSLMASRAIRKGEAFSETNITVKRPEGGLSPLYYWECLGKLADCDYQENELIEISFSTSFS